MAILISASNPRALLDKIYAAIDEKKIETWAYDKDRDFVHSPQQWAHQAWLRPTVKPDQLILGILGPKSVVMSRVVYAVYHGRFVEMVLTHFDIDTKDFRVTPFKLTPYDVYTERA